MFLSEAEVNKVLETVRGQTPEDAVLKSMKQYFHDTFDTNILDYICSTEEFGPPGKKSKRVQFITWDGKDMKKCPTATDMAVRNEVKQVFSQVCRENNLHPDFYDPSKFFPVLTEIESDITGMRIKMKQSLLETVLNSYPQIKKHAYSSPCIHVFYETDKDIVQNERNGISSVIRTRVSKTLGEVEGLEGKQLGMTVFTSLQTLKEKYNDNMYHYFHG